MIWFILAAIISIIISISIWRDYWNDLPDKIMFSFLTIVVAGLFAVLLFLGGTVITTSCAAADYELEKSYEIVALKDNQNIQGNYYLFSGYVEEDLYYYYAKETKYGYKTSKVKAANCYIKYTDKTPHIETYTADYKNKIWYLIGAPLFEERTIIYCPKDTITTEFNIDLE